MTEMTVLNGVAIEELLMAGTGALAPYLIAAALYLLPQIKTVYVTNPHHPECSAAACEAITPQVEKLLSGCGGCHAAIAAALLQAAQETGKGADGHTVRKNTGSAPETDAEPVF